MKKVLLNILIGVWLVVAIITTISLLSMNKYRVTELGSYTFIAVDSNKLQPDFQKGDLVVVKKSANPSDVKAGDDIFYYNGDSRKAIVNLASVTSSEKVTTTESTYELQGGQSLSSKYVAGTTSNCQIIKNVGAIITILQSKLGFMLIIIFPTIFLFIYELYSVLSEIKSSKKKKL